MADQRTNPGFRGLITDGRYVLGVDHGDPEIGEHSAEVLMRRNDDGTITVLDVKTTPPKRART